MRLDFIHLEFGLDCEAWVINTTLEPADCRGWDENMKEGFMPLTYFRG